MSPIDEHREVDRKLSSARTRLVSRIDELGRRVSSARNAMDVAHIIRDHPLTSVGIGLAAGMLAGLPKVGSARFIGAQLAALVSSIALQAFRASLSGWVLGRVHGRTADS